MLVSVSGWSAPSLVLLISITSTNAQSSEPHNHAWDLADIKHPSPILRQYAGAQAELGWTAAQTYQQISGHRPGQLGDQVHKVGAQHFSRQHVANAGRAYR